MSDHNNTHHDEHGTEAAHVGAGQFEVPLILGSVFWGLIIMLVNIISCNCCADEKCCSDEASCEKTEMHGGH